MRTLVRVGIPTTFVVLLTMGGCTSDNASLDDSPGDTTASVVSGAELTIRIFEGDKSAEEPDKPANAKPSQTYTLTCEPTGGDHPSPASACAFLSNAATAGEDPFAPVPDNTPCTRIYGGPQTATVSGTWRDQTVNAQYNMQGGCEIDRWLKAAPLIGDPEDGLRAT